MTIEDKLEEINLSIDDSLPIHSYGDHKEIIRQYSTLISSLHNYLTATSGLRYDTIRENEELAFRRLIVIRETLDANRTKIIFEALMGEERDCKGG